MTPETMARRLARAERRVELLELLAEDKLREIDELTVDLRTARGDLDSMQDLVPTALVIIDLAGGIVRVNHVTEAIAGRARDELETADIGALWPDFVAGSLEPTEVTWRDRDGTAIPMLVSVRRSGYRSVCVAIDLRDRIREEECRRRAQKLQSLGQLSAGIAHELNTPMQFISDNMQLLRKGFDGVQLLVDALTKVHAAAIEGVVPTELLDAVMEAERDARWSYYAARLGRAFTRAQDGVDRVRQIVGALKVFSHPRNELAPVDVNRAIDTTLVVANPELRHVARVTTEYGTLPLVMGYPDDLNQVFLNLIVNAAHAIADTGRTELGTITVRTRASLTHAEIDISDTGCGIPTAIRERVYDPFFTTKAPGRGTGQGLAMAHAVIVDRHGGQIHFESSTNGTAFHIAIPLSQPEERH